MLVPFNNLLRKRITLSGRAVERKHIFGEIPLKDYFKSEDHAEEVFASIHRKVVGTMLAAVSPRTGRCTGSDNYISGLDSKISSLSGYVISEIKGLHRAFGHKDLPKHTVKLSRREWDGVLDRIHAEIVITILIVMRDDNNLWYHDGDWMFSSLIRVEYDRSVREVKQLWNDKRNFHGRPSKQGRRRVKSLRVAPGESIGGRRVS